MFYNCKIAVDLKKNVLKTLKNSSISKHLLSRHPVKCDIFFVAFFLNLTNISELLGPNVIDLSQFF